MASLRWILATLAVTAVMAAGARASSVSVEFNGPGVSGSLALTYDTATDAKYSDAYEVIEISGMFSDLNIGLNNVPLGSLVPITRDSPQPTNLLAPHDFSRFAVASGLPEESNGFLTYDNLFYPGGSPQTASEYPLHGGFLDIYGLMFSLGSEVVDLWSNGADSNGVVSYGVAVATSGAALDYVGGVSATADVASVPEPGSLVLLGVGILGLFGRTLARQRPLIRGRFNTPRTGS